MQRTILLERTEVPYTLRQSVRARHMRLAVYPGGALVVTSPLRAPLTVVERFIIEKRDWILRTITKLSAYKAPQVRPRSKRDYEAQKERALALAQTRLAYFNRHYGLAIGKVSIRNQKSRWGSCSKKGNLNFNYRIAHLSPEVADYVIVHELCHLGEFNHSKKFWALVSQTIPHHKALRKELKGGV